MPYPPLLNHNTPAEYRTHFENIYCRGPITTFDGIGVRFRGSDFNHCFFESTQHDGNKDAFSIQRAERMDWIKAALQDENADLYQGWDKRRKRYGRTRRVALVQTNYVVVIAITRQNMADFTTAYVADAPAVGRRPATIDLIRRSPFWT